VELPRSSHEVAALMARQEAIHIAMGTEVDQCLHGLAITCTNIFSRPLFHG